MKMLWFGDVPSFFERLEVISELAFFGEHTANSCRSRANLDLIMLLESYNPTTGDISIDFNDIDHHKPAFLSNRNSNSVLSCRNDTRDFSFVIKTQKLSLRIKPRVISTVSFALVRP